jgi:hypothetical protein
MSGQHYAPAHLNPLRKPPVTIGRRLDGAQSQSGRCGEGSLSLPRINPRFLGRPALSPIYISTEPSRLPEMTHATSKLMALRI